MPLGKIPTMLAMGMLMLVALLTLGTWGCGQRQKRAENAPVPGTGPIAFSSVDDNVRHDTLLVHVTFDLRDGTCVMAASHVEERFEGIRLYRYRPRPDSSAELLAVSSPAYDSWTMRPSFFANDSARTDRLWVLANFGERQSWGQKLFRLDSAFHDIGFLDIALPERVEEDGATVLKRRDIAAHARFAFMGDSAWIRFACDSVYLYDDQRGGTDQVVPARRVSYLAAPGEGLSLWIDGEKRPVKQPG